MCTRRGWCSSTRARTSRSCTCRTRVPLLRFDDSAKRGDSAVVAGYPQDGGLDLQVATVAGRINARGQNIYNSSMVTREIYSVRSTVRPGNSGGPLLTTGGRVYGVVFARSTSDNETGHVLTADVVAATPSAWRPRRHRWTRVT